MMNQKQTTIPVQSLLNPVTVELSLTESNLLEEHLNTLNELGFQVETFGKGVFLVRGLPTVFSQMNPDIAIRAVIDDFEEDETPLADAIEAKIIGRICKKAAVKAGQVLSREEQVALLSDLESCEFPRTCPHGRPTMIHLSVDLLARQFGRS
jgi:DNA mismatch repair protein MutL